MDENKVREADLLDETRKQALKQLIISVISNEG